MPPYPRPYVPSAPHSWPPQLTVTHPASHPSRYPLRCGSRRKLRGRFRGWMLVDVTTYLKELARCVIDTKNGTRGPGIRRTTGRCCTTVPARTTAPAPSPDGNPG